MNFLAHAFLAAPDDSLVAGGILGDWVKGPLDTHALPPSFLRGVALHRAIDAFADRNEAFQRSRARFPPSRRRWSGILVDMYYDHLLAAHWPLWHPQTLEVFTQEAYRALAEHSSAFNDTKRYPEIQSVMAMMEKEDWFGHYATPEGLNAILRRMGHRARQPNPLAEGAQELTGSPASFAAFYEDFAEFLPAARLFVAHWLNQSPPIEASV